MKSLFYIISIVSLLSACVEKAEEKTFINKNIKSFLEYNEIAGATSRLHLPNILAKMSESKLHISDYKFSKDCQQTLDYVVDNMDAIQNIYKKFIIDSEDLNSDDYILDINAKEALEDVIQYPKCKDVLLSSLYNTNMLIKEISKPDSSIDTVMKYINNNANLNIDINGYTILDIAVQSESPQTLEIIKLLIDNGAIIKNTFGLVAILGESTLHIAIRSKNLQAPEIVKLLIDNSADINDKEFLDEVLHKAVQSENPRAPEIITVLIEKGADVNGKDYLGNTVLQNTIKSKNPKALEIVELLLEYGADVNAKDKNGNTIYDRARENKNIPYSKIKNLLDKYNKNNNKE